MDLLCAKGVTLPLPAPFRAYQLLVIPLYTYITQLEFPVLANVSYAHFCASTMSQ